MVAIVKRRGQKQEFDEKKVYGSVYAACMACQLHEKECEKISDSMVDEVKKFLKGKKEVNSTEIFGLVVQKLAKIREDAAFMYETHREIS